MLLALPSDPAPGEIDVRSVIVLLLSCGLGLATAGCDKRSEGGVQAGGVAGGVAAGAGNASAPTSGEVPPAPGGGQKAELEGATGRVDRSQKGAQAPDLIFTGPDGKDVTLADFRGKPVLVNLWATWCGPCVAEMPTLDQAAADHARDGLVVLAVSQDMGEEKPVADFFRRLKLKRLALYRDPENQLGFHYATGLFPTTVLYDREGREVARVAGAMDWTGEQADALIEEAIR
jgi:thiol-disulfide isomerase/thioredoxin